MRTVHPPARGPDQLDGLGSAFGVHVRADDGRPLGREQGGSRPPLTAGGTGDQRDLAVEAAHVDARTASLIDVTPPWAVMPPSTGISARR